jgi:hypothetical protein
MLELLEQRLAPAAGTFQVTNNASSGAGSFAFELAQAELPANVGSTVAFTPQVTSSPILLASTQQITQSTTVVNNSGHAVTLSGAAMSSGSGSDFSITGSGSVVTINGAGKHGSSLTITGGGTAVPTASGGGINVGAGTNVLLENLTVSGNTASSDVATAEGGGIFSSGTLQLTNVVVSGNQATSSQPSRGGGIANTGKLTISGGSVSGNAATVSGNPTAEGGGIWDQGSLLSVTGTTITGNEATRSDSEGGGVFSRGDASVSFTNATIGGGTASSALAQVPRVDERGHNRPASDSIDVGAFQT